MKKYNLVNIKHLNIPIKTPYLIYLKGDLGAGKTTISKHIINNLLGVKELVTSPTYTYYNKYEIKTGEFKFKNIYHFDLYRLKNYEEFFSIGAEEIFDNNFGIILVEWPEIIEKYYKSDIEINIEKTEKENQRKITITPLLIKEGQGVV